MTAEIMTEYAAEHIGETDGVVELALCETEMVILKPDQLYRFVVVPGCERCAKLQEMGKGKGDG